MVARVSIPVIGNGDVEYFASLKALFTTGCAGAIIARAGVGQPWLFEKLRSEGRALCQINVARNWAVFY